MLTILSLGLLMPHPAGGYRAGWEAQLALQVMRCGLGTDKLQNKVIRSFLDWSGGVFLAVNLNKIFVLTLLNSRICCFLGWCDAVVLAVHISTEYYPVNTYMLKWVMCWPFLGWSGAVFPAVHISTEFNLPSNEIINYPRCLVRPNTNNEPVNY